MDVYTTFGLIMLGAFFVFVGWKHRIQGSGEGYETAEDSDYHSRRIDIKRLVSTLFTVVGAGEYALAVTLVVIYGFSGISFLLGLGVAFFTIAYMIPIIWKSKSSLAHSLPLYSGYISLTTPDYFYFRFGRLCSIPSTIITVAAFWGLLVLQLVLGGALIESLSGLSFVVSVLLMAIVIFFYTVLGGFAAIFFTDYWQKLFMWLGLLAVVFYILYTQSSSTAWSEFFTGSIAALRPKSLSVDPNIIILFLITIAAAFGGPDLWQRANLAKSKREAAGGLKWAGISIFVFAIVIVLFSFDVYRLIPTIQASGVEITDHLSAYMGYVSDPGNGANAWPAWLVFAFALGLISAFISTADTSSMLSVTALFNELSRTKKDKHSKEVSTTQLNYSIAAVIFSAAIIAIFLTNIADAFTAVLGILGVMGIPVFLSLFGLGNKYTGFLAMTLGVLILIIQTYFLPSQYNDGYYLLLPFLPGLLPLFTVFSSRGENDG